MKYTLNPNADTTHESGVPRIVCLCGSTRFFHEFQVANFRETMAGKIVLSVGFYAGSPGEMKQEHGDGVGITEEEKVMLDELHKRKIDLADEVLVLNVGGYVGSSTLSEIIHADRTKKPLRWLEKSKCPCCKGRGGFDGDEDCFECALCHGSGSVGGGGAELGANVIERESQSGAGSES